MNRKKWAAAVCALCVGLSLVGCSKKNQVYVQSVQALVNLGGIAPGDRFSGMVVSENVTEIKKDEDKTVAELLVKEGQDVKAGQALFSYDTQELQLNLDKQRLEKEQLEASIENFKEQIKTLEQALGTVGGTTKLQYTIEIQSTQVDLKEAEIKLKTKENEVKKSEELLKNASVTSPVDGRVQNISEGETDRNGQPLPYITIQQIGSYRVKGVLGELQRGAIAEGSRVEILSRTNAEQKWTGTVTLVDYENPSQDGGMSSSMVMMGPGSGNEMNTTSKYPFYVELDGTEGLILGQHVYVQQLTEGGQATGPCISASFICYNEDGSAYVWAEKGGKLEKRPVELGEYNSMTDAQEITSGLSMDDYIAFPDPTTCVEGASTTREMPKVSEQTEAPMDDGGEMPPMEGGV